MAVVTFSQVMWDVLKKRSEELTVERIWQLVKLISSRGADVFERTTE